MGAKGAFVGVAVGDLVAYGRQLEDPAVISNCDCGDAHPRFQFLLYCTHDDAQDVAGYTLTECDFVSAELKPIHNGERIEIATTDGVLEVEYDRDS